MLRSGTRDPDQGVPDLESGPVVSEARTPFEAAPASDPVQVDFDGRAALRLEVRANRESLGLAEPTPMPTTDGRAVYQEASPPAEPAPPPLPLTSDVLPADGCPKCERERWVALPDGGRYCGGCGHGFPVPPVSAARRERERLRDEREQAEAEERRRKARRYRLRSALNPEGHVVEDVETVNPESRLRNSGACGLARSRILLVNTPFGLDRRLGRTGGTPRGGSRVSRRVLDRALGHRWVTDARRAPRSIAGGTLVM